MLERSRDKIMLTEEKLFQGKKGDIKVKNRILKFAIIFIVFFSLTEAYSQDSFQMTSEAGSPEKISLAQAIDFAFKNSEEIKITSQQVSQSESQYRERLGDYYPHIDAQVSWTNNLKYPVNDVYPKAANYNYVMNNKIKTTQLVYSFGKVDNAVRAAKESINTNFFKKEATQEEIRFASKIAYYAVIFRKNILLITEESYQNALENKDILENRTFAGRVSRKDNIEIESDLASRIPFLSSAKAELISAENTLKRVMGISLVKNIELADTLAESYEYIKEENLLERMYQEEPSLKAYNSLIKVQESIVKAKKAEHLPTISGFGQWEYNGKNDNNAFVGSSNMDNFAVIGVQVEIPIWEGGQITERVNQAQEDKVISELEYQKRQKDLTLELKNAISDYTQYIITLKANKEAVKLAEQRFSLFQDLFHTGQVSVLELNDAELALTNNKVNMQETIFRINQSMATIEKLVLSGDIT
ncbi:MAG: TolC family protein [Candidatus Omnitrophica bacterium]|nr:TolC family protein [Candidatus Omnitrophota bacterium]